MFTWDLWVYATWKRALVSIIARVLAPVPSKGSRKFGPSRMTIAHSKMRDQSWEHGHVWEIHGSRKDGHRFSYLNEQTMRPATTWASLGRRSGVVNPRRQECCNDVVVGHVDALELRRRNIAWMETLLDVWMDFGRLGPAHRQIRCMEAHVYRYLTKPWTGASSLPTAYLARSSLRYVRLHRPLAYFTIQWLLRFSCICEHGRDWHSYSQLPHIDTAAIQPFGTSTFARRINCWWTRHDYSICEMARSLPTSWSSDFKKEISSEVAYLAMVANWHTLWISVVTRMLC